VDYHLRQLGISSRVQLTRIVLEHDDGAGHDAEQAPSRSIAS
jgi:hypothetical protein